MELEIAVCAIGGGCLIGSLLGPGGVFIGALLGGLFGAVEYTTRRRLK